VIRRTARSVDNLSWAGRRLAHAADADHLQRIHSIEQAMRDVERVGGIAAAELGRRHSAGRPSVGSRTARHRHARRTVAESVPAVRATIASRAGEI
jgi:hypothetical protein